MDIKIVHAKGKEAKVVIDLNLLMSIVNPDKLKNITGSDFLIKTYQNESQNNSLADIENYESFEDWLSALQEIDKRDPKEILPEYGMTLVEFRKMIWDAENNLQNLLTFQEFKEKCKKKKSFK